MPAQPKLHALLIGIDCYMGHTIDGLPYYGPLRGCVRDVELMEEFLTTRLPELDVAVTKLVAAGNGKKPSGPKKSWPTKANLISAFEKLAKDVKKDEQVYIHYSGHGGRAVTLYPDAKGAEGLDESLVPTDYGQIENKVKPEDRYLRDLELNRLLQQLVEREAVVTVVLDSCHSGGASRGIGDGRGDGPTVRGSGDVDRVARTAVDWVASPDALMTGWEQASRGTRSVDVAAGWLPDPDGYTLLAACRALELASENSMPNGKRHGYLTYWLWHALQRHNPSWEAVHQRVFSEVKGRNGAQSPQLQGVGDRAIFGGAAVALPAGVNVLDVQGEKVRLDIGRAGGVGKGAKFFVYPSGVTSFKETEKRLGVVEVTDSKTTDSWAKILRTLSENPIETGAQALLFDPGAAQQRTVALQSSDQVDAAVEKAALEAVADTLRGWENRHVRLAHTDEAADFIVTVVDSASYDIQDGHGAPLPHRPPTPLDNPDEVVYQLVHLARYQSVMSLNNPDPVSAVEGKLEVTLMQSEDQPFNAPGGIPTVKSGEDVYYLRIVNRFEPLPGPPSDDVVYIEGTRRRTLNVCVLNLAPEWAISRIIPPPGAGANSIELGPGKTLRLPRYDLPDNPVGLPAFRSSLPAGATEALDVIKVFATTETTNSYDSLQLPGLTDIGKRASLVVAKPPEPDNYWGAVQVAVRVVA